MSSSFSFYRPAKKFIQQISQVDAKVGEKLTFKKDLETHHVPGKKMFLPCIQKVTFYYNIPRIGAGGNSIGMIEYLENNLLQLTKSRPYIHFQVKRRNGPPEIVAEYYFGTSKSLDMSRKKDLEIAKVVKQLCDSNSLFDSKKSPITSTRAAVPVEAPWNPFHFKP